jgi:ribose 5-phosphate isomerase B
VDHDESEERQTEYHLQEVLRLRPARRDAELTGLAAARRKPRGRKPNNVKETALRLVVGSDHAGWLIKKDVLALLAELGHDVTDVGSFDARPVDFPDIARNVAAKIISGEAERGIMVCGTGVGAAIAANKMKGIRAAVCHDVHSAHQGVEHDDVNVMCLGAQIVGLWLARDLISAFLAARFSTDADFRRRVAKLHEMDAGT